MRLAKILRTPLEFSILFFVSYLRKMNRDTKVAELRLHTAMDVHHPGFSSSSRILAAYLSKKNFTDANVLDMGAGVGVLGLIAAKKGAKVIAVDNNSLAVQLTRMNAERHHLGAKISCIESDLFERISTESAFDYILFNPPFLPKKDAAQKYGIEQVAAARLELLQVFFNHAHRFLSQNGRVITIVNSDMPLAKIDQLITESGWEIERELSKNSLFRTYSTLILKRAI